MSTYGRQYSLSELKFATALDTHRSKHSRYPLRNNWHVHHAARGGGQILLCTAGRGWYQEWGKPARALRAGDVVHIPAGVRHWHGAAADSWFVHLAVEIPGEDTRNEWLEPVSDAEYAALSAVK